MKNKRIILISAGVVLIFLAIGFLLLRPSYINFNMTCMEMTADGEELKEGKLVLEGWTYQAQFWNTMRFAPAQVSIPGFDSSNIVSSDELVSYLSPAYITSCVFQIENGRFLPAEIVWHEDLSCCVVLIEGRYFVGSVSGDYAAALGLFHSVLAPAN